MIKTKQKSKQTKKAKKKDTPFHLISHSNFFKYESLFVHNFTYICKKKNGQHILKTEHPYVHCLNKMNLRSFLQLYSFQSMQHDILLSLMLTYFIMFIGTNFGTFS